jgi:hypothetical protein
MKKETVRTLTIVVGLVILLAVLGLGSAVWLFTQSVDVGKADEVVAAQEFDRVRARFPGVTPVLEISDGEPALARKPPDRQTGKRLTTLHVLHWDPDDDKFARVDLPFWLIRLKSGPIEIVSNNNAISHGELGITVEELERFGPTLVADHVGESGDRLLIWTQ